jgi:sugar O-acyltransferase (sialic acid O-acetyltransferase NeuD family)
MKNLIIIGAGGYGREIYGTAMGLEQRNPGWRLKGFLDDRAGLLDGLPYERPILGPVETYEPGPDDLFVCAIGAPEARRRYTGMIIARGGRLTNLVHWTAITTPRIAWGSGILVGAYCTLSTEVTIGDSACFNAHVSVGHDAVIGRYCQLQSFSFVGGGARLGEGVILQTHAVVLPGARVGDGAIIGAGSVALRKVAPATTVFGVPATKLGPWKPDDTA